MISLVKQSSKRWKVLQMASQNSKRKQTVDVVDVVVTMKMMTIVAVAMTIMNMSIIMNMSTIITTMRKKNAAVVVLPNTKNITMNTTMTKKKVAAVVDRMTIITNTITTIIMDMMQMKYLHQSVSKQ